MYARGEQQCLDFRGKKREKKARHADRMPMRRNSIAFTGATNV
jgi:hypothetical protein